MIGNRDPPAPARSSVSEDLEQLLAALDDSVRRQALGHLDPDEGQIELSTLAERIADADPGNVKMSRDQVEIALHHNHLPKLAEYGLVEYNSENHLVAATPPTWAEPYLDLVKD